ncbi:peptide chain release factor N(5)-glutamine methyltransferase [Pedobacter sp. Du54]|uniref:peptide chain release factor N(5)-glutamine methyltransferase n=1 Tax=Pedobacter anseongensis TaxID=3133439 RepID=UPI0030AC2927
MKLSAIVAKFIDELASHYDVDEAKAIFLLVIEHYLKIDKANYILKKEHELADENVKIIESILFQLKAGRPIQYILGETMFYGLPFKVNESVLIPRPETEELVAWVIEKLKKAEPATLLDIGTGSGCIAISLKKNLPQLAVTALDISSEALGIAKENALLNDIELSFVEHNILTSQISQFPTTNSILNTAFSVIVSNPPYITQNEKMDMHENVLANEPHLALFVSNERPLLFYEVIADFALKNLTENGLLFFEINEYLGKETVEMLAKKGFNTIELRKDMQSKDRMICCKKP